MISSQRRYQQAAYESMTGDGGLVPGTKEAEIYGAVCHHFPTMLRLNGLRLTAMFYQSKAKLGGQSGENLRNTGDTGKSNKTDRDAKNLTSPREQAYRRYLSYMGKALGLEDAPFAAQTCGQEADYRLLSRQALAASVWFKRYAEALLKVESTVTEDEVPT